MKTGTDESISKMRWRGYIKTISLGCNLPASSARLCVMLDCDTPGRCREKVAQMHEQGKISQDDAMNYLDAISDLEGMYARGVQTHKISTPTAEWHPLNEGCHLRKIHKEADKRTY